MINLDLLPIGTPVEDILPDYRKLLGSLDAQKRKYEEQELEAGLGPVPTQTNMTLGAAEMWAIKKMSGFPYGNTVLRNLNKGIDVLSIVDVDGQEAEQYKTVWKTLFMDRKLEILKRDYRIGGSAYVEMGLDAAGNPVWNVKSPKKATTFSSDAVNNVWADFAIEVFKNSGVDYFRFYDTSSILTFGKDKDKGYVLVESEPHTFGVCPIVPIHNIITSDGEVSGNIELLKPILDTLRQRTNSIGQGSYWSGTRTFVIENLDLEETRIDENGNEYLVADKVMKSIQMTDAGVVLLPTGANIGENPKLSQTEESNIIQLIEAKKDVLRDLAANTGLPYHLFDGTATPTTAEGSIQAYNSNLDDKMIDKINIGTVLELMLMKLVEVATGQYVELNILWNVSEKVSMNNVADTVSKYSAAGLPAEWIADNVLAGFHPKQIAQLKELLANKSSLAAEQTKMIMKGL